MADKNNESNDNKSNDSQGESMDIDSDSSVDHSEKQKSSENETKNDEKQDDKQNIKDCKEVEKLFNEIRDIWNKSNNGEDNLYKNTETKNNLEVSNNSLFQNNSQKNKNVSWNFEFSSPPPPSDISNKHEIFSQNKPKWRVKPNDYQISNGQPNYQKNLSQSNVFQPNNFQTNYQSNMFQPNYQPNMFQSNYQPNMFQPNIFQPNYQPNMFQPNNYQPNNYQPNNYQPNNYQPNNYQPNNYQPNNYQPNNYQPNNYQPNNFQNSNREYNQKYPYNWGRNQLNSSMENNNDYDYNRGFSSNSNQNTDYNRDNIFPTQKRMLKKNYNRRSSMVYDNFRDRYTNKLNNNNKKKNYDMVIHSAICDKCGMSPIKGDRYKSLIKNDYDLCKNCWLNCKDKSNYQLIKDFKNIDTNVQGGAVVLEINSNGTMNPQESKFLETFFDKVLNKDTKDKIDGSKKITKEEEEKENEQNNKFSANKDKEIDEIDIDVSDLNDLIKLSDLYDKEDFKDKNYSINLKGIHDMVPALKELQSLVGLENVKKKVLDQIIFFSQDLHNQYEFIDQDEKKERKQASNPLFQILSLSNKPANTNEEFNKYESCLKNDDNLDMLHTVIEGPPGVGKTIFGKILARVYLSLGITHKDKFKIVRRTDLVGEYLGHTAMKTQKVIDEALGGVLFIDEAYQLGNGSERKIDSYSKECIDTLNQNLSEKKGQFICIIAGYKRELEENFFSVNPGLKRRFSFKYSIESYTWKELTKILIHKIPKMKWEIDEETIQKLFDTQFLKEKMDQFPHFGGDIETLLLNVKIEHGKRVFGKKIDLQKKINYEDITKGYERFIENRKVEKEILPFGMFI
jgi:broad-specificity NMP kinase